MSGGRLRAALAEYLAVRRSLGFKLARDGLLLEQFAGFCEQAGASRVTSELALAWVSAPVAASPGWLAMRLTVVRGFAGWLQASDPATEVPPLGWLPPRRRTAPYLYSADDVAALLAAARRVRWPLSAASYETLIALLAVTGMRVGEAIRLDRSDLSPGEGLLTIWDSKFGTSRQLLLHPSTVSALGCYLRRRAELSPAPGEPALLVHPAGNRLNYPAVQQMFKVLLGRAGIRPRSDRCRPTIHGLRHSFAVNTLIRWYREGADVQARLPQLSTWLGHTDPKWTYWYLSASPELLALAAERLEALPGDAVMSAIAPALQEYFTQRLIGQRQASPHTVAAYRDCFRLLFAYVAQTSGKQPAELGFEDLDAGTIGGFLTHLEKQRGVSIATRNARLVALRSWFAFAARRHPEHAALIARVLAIPSKRRDRPLVSFLEPDETDALLNAPDAGRWAGRRDRVLLTFAVQTGLRASELTAVRTADIALGRGAHVQVLGKGRKERAVPLSRHTVAVLHPWLSERAGDPGDPVFPGPGGRPLGRDTVRKLVIRHARSAAAECPSLAAKKVGVHTLRHTCAMTLLRSGVDLATIALWLGHEDLRTVQVYLHADLELKERALARTAPPGTTPGRYHPPDPVLAFLESL